MSSIRWTWMLAIALALIVALGAGGCGGDLASTPGGVTSGDATERVPTTEL